MTTRAAGQTTSGTTATTHPAYREAPGAVPAGVLAGRWMARPQDRDVVVFLIGMRVNRWRRVRSWWPLATQMPGMLRQLADQPGLGLLGVRGYRSGRVFLFVQYWRSLEHLERFARDPELTHAPAWRAFNRAAAGSGDVGIFHETYQVPADRIESVYGNMAPLGLGEAVGLVGRPHGRR